MPSDEDGAVTTGGRTEDGGSEGGDMEDEPALKGAFEKAILDAMSAERRLCASFSLAWFTRLTTPRIASPAFLTASSTDPAEESEGEAFALLPLTFLRLSRSWSSNRGYLHIRWTGLIK